MSTEIQSTSCVLDCPDSCSLAVTVEDGRITAIRPSDANPDTDGFICSKVSNFHRRVYHPDRVLHPLRRVGEKGAGQFERISWDEALDEIATRFQEIRQRHGSEAILPFHYGGSNGFLSDGLLDRLFFARLGASRLAKTICAVPATEVAVGMYGKMPGVAFSDFPEAKCIVVWGANPRGSNIHLIPHLRAARDRGAEVITVDPRRNLTDREHSQHLPVLPGQDLPLALGMIRWWRERGALDRDFLASETTGSEALLEAAQEWPLERTAGATGLSEAEIERAATTIAESRPLLVRCGWGIERNVNGGQAVAAVLSIPALLGRFGERGGGYTLSNNGDVSFDPTSVLGDFDWTTRELNMTQLGRILGPELEPPIKAVFVYNANPVATVPDQVNVERGLRRDDLFTVVHEQVLTDTTRYADLVLPATTFLEAWDLRPGYGSYVFGGIRPTIEPVGEARSNLTLFAELGRRLGFDDEPFGWDDETFCRKVIASTRLAGRPLDVDTVLSGGLDRYDFPGETPVQFETVRPRTPDGRVQLAPSVLGDEPYRWKAPTDAAPLALITPASSMLITSTLGEVNVDVLRVTLHPDDARERRLSRGDRVRVFNDLGEVHCHLEISDRVRPGVASMPKGAWRRSSINGATSVALCPDDAQVVGDAACFNDARVEVAALESSA